jgi:hypothetical protein
MDYKVIDNLLEYHARQKAKMYRSFKSLVKYRHETSDKNLLKQLMESDKRRYKFHKEGIEIIIKLQGMAHSRLNLK